MEKEKSEGKRRGNEEIEKNKVSEERGKGTGEMRKGKERERK